MSVSKPKHKVPRTAAQKQALREAYIMLAENFDHFLLVSCTSGDQQTITTDLDVYWKGGWLQANGLADFAKRRIEYQLQTDMIPN